MNRMLLAISAAFAATFLSTAGARAETSPVEQGGVCRDYIINGINPKSLTGSSNHVPLSRLNQPGQMYHPLLGQPVNIPMADWERIRKHNLPHAWLIFHYVGSREIANDPSPMLAHKILHTTFVYATRNSGCYAQGVPIYLNRLSDNLTRELAVVINPNQNKEQADITRTILAGMPQEGHWLMINTSLRIRLNAVYGTNIMPPVTEAEPEPVVEAQVPAVPRGTPARAEVYEAAPPATDVDLQESIKAAKEFEKIFKQGQ